MNDNGSADSSYLYRSVLTRWRYGQDIFSSEFDGLYKWSVYMKNGIQLMGVPLGNMYKLAYIGKTFMNYWDTAYYGKFWKDPILELNDSSAFVPDFLKSKNLFGYSLIVPDSMATDSVLQNGMKNDLSKYFGYSATLEERKMPAWIAVRTRDLSHLKTKGGPKVRYTGMSSAPNLRMKNVPPANLFTAIAGYNQTEPPIIDSTGLDTNIDFELEGVPDDITEVDKALNKLGIDLIRSTKTMKVLVIRDANKP